MFCVLPYLGNSESKCIVKVSSPTLYCCRKRGREEGSAAFDTLQNLAQTHKSNFGNSRSVEQRRILRGSYQEFKSYIFQSLFSKFKRHLAIEVMAQSHGHRSLCQIELFSGLRILSHVHPNCLWRQAESAPFVFALLPSLSDHICVIGSWKSWA